MGNKKETKPELMQYKEVNPAMDTEEGKDFYNKIVEVLKVVENVKTLKLVWLYLQFLYVRE